jgi:hypothetical protein
LSCGSKGSKCWPCVGAIVHLLSACLESVNPGGAWPRKRFSPSQPFPHYHPQPDRPGMLLRIDANG